MFPDKPAINVRPHKDGISVSSMRSGILDAVNILNGSDRQTGETEIG